jgi:signal transduction histidine kinase
MDDLRKSKELIQTAIYRIAQAALITHDLEELFPAIHAIIAELMPARNFYITLYDPETDLFSVPYVVDEFNEKWSPYKPGKGMGAYILRTGQPLLVTPETFHQMEQEGQVEIIAHRMIDYMGVPLRTQHGIIGVMGVQTYHETERLTPSDLDVLVFVSTQVAMVIERKQVEQRLITSAEQNALLHQQVQLYAVELEQRVAERTAQLEAANKELEAFSYSVSHDLRSPLRAIEGYTRLLQLDYGEKLDAEGQELLDRVSATARRMSQLIDDLIKLSRLNRQEINRERVDLSLQANDILARFCEQNPERSVEVRITPGLSAECDLPLIRVVLENLLGNAWKFTRQIPQARIEFSATEGESGTLFFVRDNGAGFNMKYADKLFGAFQRLHRAEDFEGSGIGLATVQRIIHRHGGQVWAEGEVDRGATFFFTLP